MSETTNVNGSILNDVKSFIGFESDYTPFDKVLIMHINAALGVLYQLGVGDSTARITDASNTWSEVIGSSTDLEMAKEYVCLKTQLLFDAPSASSMVSVLQDAIKEMEFRVGVNVDPKEETV